MSQTDVPPDLCRAVQPTRHPRLPRRVLLSCAVLSLLAGAGVARGQGPACRWITADEATRILAEPVKAPTSTGTPVEALTREVPGLVEVTDCTYGVQRGVVGQVGATVWRFRTAAEATARIEAMRSSAGGSGGRVSPVRGIGDGGFLVQGPLPSHSSMTVRKGAAIVRLARIAGPALRAAIDAAPDEERFDLFGLMPLALGRL